MILEVEIYEGQSAARHVRVLARVPVLTEVVVFTRDLKDRIISRTSVKRGGQGPKMQRVYDHNTDTEHDRLCCLFDIETTDFQRHEKRRTSLWLSIEK